MFPLDDDVQITQAPVPADTSIPTTDITLDPSVVNHPWVVYAMVLIGVGSLFLAFIRRESGAFGEWLSAMRRASEAREDARVTGMEKDIAYLKQKDSEKGKRIDLLEAALNEVRDERDALVNYLREWWNWALLGSDGPPPTVPEELRALLPPSSWTWRPGYRVNPDDDASGPKRNPRG